MKYLVFSDLHFFRGREYLVDTCKWIADQIYHYKPERVVFCGDLNHSHNSIETDTLHLMANAISVVASAARSVTKEPLVALSGNHDTTLRSTAKNIIEAVGMLSPDINPITFAWSDGNASYAPYPPAGEKFDGYLAKLHSFHNELIFGHLELAEIAYSPASPVETDHPFPLPIQTKYVVNGHYHHPQRKMVGKVDVTIIGAPCYHSYSDCLVDTPRGILLLDHQPGVKLDTMWVENPHGPIYHTITTHQLDAVAKHPSVKRMRIRVKVDSKEAYEEAKPAIMRLRELAETVRVMASSSQVVSQIHQQETHTVALTDPSALLKDYTAKKNLPAAIADVGMKFLSEASE